MKIASAITKSQLLHATHVLFCHFLACAKLTDTMNVISVYLNCVDLHHCRKFSKKVMDAAQRGANGFTRPVATCNFAAIFPNFFDIIKKHKRITRSIPFLVVSHNSIRVCVRLFIHPSVCPSVRPLAGRWSVCNLIFSTGRNKDSKQLMPCIRP